MAEAQVDDVMTLVYTSGTTGPPKGSMLTNSNFSFCLTTLVAAIDRMPGNVLPNQTDQMLTYLPLCHVAERIFSTWTLASSGDRVEFRRVDRNGAAEPARDPADAVFRRSADLGKAARRAC